MSLPEEINDTMPGPSAIVILPEESNDAMSSSMDINNFYSQGCNLNTVTYENSWNTYTTNMNSPYDINDEIGVQERVIHYSEVYETRSLGGIVSQNETDLLFDSINYRWQMLRYDCFLNVDGHSLGHMLVR